MLQRLVSEDIELKWIPGDDVGKIRMDPGQVNQILANLVVNSKDAVKGPGIITIKTLNTFLDEGYCKKHEGCVPGDYVALTVTDNGSGMPQEVLEKVFEPFYTTKEIGKGTGLGLSTVYGIVKQNSGYITIHSQPGLGTTVEIYFPKLSDQSKVEPAKAEDRGMPTGSETVLLVEDQEQLLNITKNILTRLGYSVLEAISPQQAIELAENHNGEIQLLLTDIIMPQMQGTQLAEQLQRRRKDMRVLYMSGYTAETIDRHGLFDKGSHFIEKPFLAQKLAEKLREILDQR
jgi:two-component system, cell cycle sensor histidine kinase and response regulator CckA